MKSRRSVYVRRVLIGVTGLVLVLVAVRAALPWWVARYVNDRFAEMGDYRGHVSEVDIALIRGAYTLRDLTIVKPTAGEERPFLKLPVTDISVEWSALLDGELVGEVQMRDPVINMVQEETPAETQTGTGVDWAEQVGELFPFRFNRIEVRNGTVTFRAPGIEENQSLTLHRVNALVTNLTNRSEVKEEAFAEFDVSATFAEATPLALNGRVNPLAPSPAFDLNASLENARLTDLNPWLREFVNVDAEKGTFSLYAEVAAADGRFEGYLKPLLEDVEIFRLDEPSDGVLQKAWEGLVGIVSGILTNPDEEQVATQIPFSGDLDDPDTDAIAAAVNLLRNAFVAAFTHALENSVSIEEVEREEGE